MAARPSVPMVAAAAWVVLYALSGFCALALETVWFRIIDVTVKATAFTFGTVLAVYLAGSAVGTIAGAAPSIVIPRRRGSRSWASGWATRPGPPRAASGRATCASSRSAPTSTVNRDLEPRDEFNAR